MNIDLDELISFCAKRGDTEAIALLNFLKEEWERHIDPDYNSETETEESECSMTDIVEEDIIINPSMNGFESLS
jgi:hypothetical protein